MTHKPAHRALSDLDFDDFKSLAQDASLSAAQRIGFPDEYRAGFEPGILDDIRAKLPAFDRPGSTVIDIGCGCGELAVRIVEHGARRGSQLWLVDSAEVLARLPDATNIRKVPGRFPDDTADGLRGLAGRCDAVLCYSVFHYVFVSRNPYGFLDGVLALLAPGGACLVGDIPNVAMRRRFLDSDSGRRHHRAYCGRDEDPVVTFNRLDPGVIDDAVVFGLLAYARQAGFHAWIVPQPPELPLSNRREDILILRP